MENLLEPLCQDDYKDVIYVVSIKPQKVDTKAYNIGEERAG